MSHVQSKGDYKDCVFPGSANCQINLEPQEWNATYWRTGQEELRSARRKGGLDILLLYLTCVCVIHKLYLTNIIYNYNKSNLNKIEQLQRKNASFEKLFVCTF